MSRRIPLAALGFALAAGPLVAQEPTGQVGRCMTPDTVVIRGNSRVHEDVILNVGGIRGGMTLNFPTIQRTIRDLFATADFDDVTLRCGVAGSGDRAAIVITVRERPLLGNITVEGPRQVSASAVGRRCSILLLPVFSRMSASSGESNKANMPTACLKIP